MPKHLILLLAFLPLLLACSGREGKEELLPKVTVITSTGGFGDNGYNDLIMRGIMHFYDKAEVRLSLINPISGEDASKELSKWLCESSESECRQLLVLADNRYESLVRSAHPALTESQAILLFESRAEDLPNGITSFHINRYGAFYLAGCMAAPHSAANIIAALQEDATLKDAICGFSDGYRDAGQKEAEVFYLADDVSGYSMPDSAYRVAASIHNSFILPLAGGSNNGIYKYSREEPFYMPLIVGMDVDCSLFSHRVPFSIVIHIDSIIEKHLNAWLEQTPFESHYSYGLSDGAISIVLSDVFYKNTYLFEDYYEDYAYWGEAYKKHYDEAVKKEEQYEKK